LTLLSPPRARAGAGGRNCQGMASVRIRHRRYPLPPPGRDPAGAGLPGLQSWTPRAAARPETTTTMSAPLPVGAAGSDFRARDAPGAQAAVDVNGRSCRRQCAERGLP
jgi:hypothetical protein